MGKPDRPRHQLWSFVYLPVRRVLSLLLLVFRSGGSKEVEILVLRHGLEVLRRNQPRPRFEPADRAWLCALSRLLAKAAGRRSSSDPRPSLADTGNWSPGTGRTPHTAALGDRPSERIS